MDTPPILWEKLAEMWKRTCCHPGGLRSVLQPLNICINKPFKTLERLDDLGIGHLNQGGNLNLAERGGNRRSKNKWWRRCLVLEASSYIAKLSLVGRGGKEVWQAVRQATGKSKPTDTKYPVDADTLNQHFAKFPQTKVTRCRSRKLQLTSLPQFSQSRVFSVC